jgi:hypothetical protein
MAPFAVQRHRSEMGGDFPFASTAATGPDAPPPLDPETVEHFCREGWLVARGFLSAERAAELRAAAVELLQRFRRNWRDPAQRLPPPSESTPMWHRTGHAVDLHTGELAGVAFDAWMQPEGSEGGDPTASSAAADTINPHRVQYINDIHDLEPAFARYSRDPELLALLSQLLGDDIDCTQCATVTKPGGINFDYHGWHQDIADYGGSGGIQADGDEQSYRYDSMTNFGNVGTITYLGPGPSGPDTGSTSVLPRSHRTADGAEGPILLPVKTLRPGWPEPVRSVAGMDETLEAEAVTPVFEEGDLLVFDSWLLHRANSNLEKLSKIGIVQVFCRPDCLPLSKLQDKADKDGDAATGGRAVFRGGRPVAAGERTEEGAARL